MRGQDVFRLIYDDMGFLQEPRQVGEVCGIKIFEDPEIPSGEVHFKDSIDGRLLGRIIGWKGEDGV